MKRGRKNCLTSDFLYNYIHHVMIIIKSLPGHGFDICDGIIKYKVNWYLCYMNDEYYVIMWSQDKRSRRKSSVDMSVMSDDPYLFSR